MNLKNQPELLRRLNHNGRIYREILKYTLSVDDEDMGSMICERLSEYEADEIIKDFARHHGISTAGVKLRRVVRKSSSYRIPHLGMVK